MQTYKSTFTVKRLWQILLLSLLVSFSILLYFGGQIYQKAPPMPTVIKTVTGKIVYTKDDIERGQNVWQSTGGMQQGSIWGHGSYLAPDWSADWLHREALALLSLIARDEMVGVSASDEQQLEMHKVTLRHEMRKNTYDPHSGIVIVSPNRAQAINTVAQHYINLFTAKGERFLKLRKDYAFPVNSALENQDAQHLTAFFWWSAWAAVTNRPNDDVSYTSNWPHDPLVGNTPSASILMWSLISILMLLAGIGWIVWYYARQFDGWRSDLEPENGFAQEDIITTTTITPSMRATAKYFWVVTALFVVQVLLGIVTAHYAIEGQGLYGLPLVDYLPYAVTRTWHTQLSILWIVTAWLATGLYFAPMLSGHEPKYQRFRVNFLFFSLLIRVCSVSTTY